MPDPRRAAYLDAMGVDVYVRRDLPPPIASAANARGDAPVLDWDALRQAVAGCTRCELHATRTQTVFGVGRPDARWMFIGEAPGADEDRQGEPFVGRAGQLLTSMIRALGLRREDVYIANVLKCRPPGNRNPQPEEVASCEPFLLRQIELVSPHLLLIMGRFAAQTILHTDAPISALRGRVHRVRVRDREVSAVVTYHPAYLLRNLVDKAKSWADLCLALDVDARAGK